MFKMVGCRNRWLHPSRATAGLRVSHLCRGLYVKHDLSNQ